MLEILSSKKLKVDDSELVSVGGEKFIKKLRKSKYQKLFKYQKILKSKKLSKNKYLSKNNTIKKSLWL